jgi:hypothetical protein
MKRGVFAGLLFGIMVGCGGDPAVDPYLPEAEKAEKALVTALDAWKGGASLKTVQGDGHAIDVFDARWRSGAKLEDFEVLSEVPGELHPTFLVRTRIKGKDEETKYLVFGIDPINVFRAEEYQKTTGM